MTLQQGHAPISRWVFSVQSHPRFRQSGSIGKTFRNVLKTLGQSCNLLAGQQARSMGLCGKELGSRLASHVDIFYTWILVGFFTLRRLTVWILKTIVIIQRLSCNLISMETSGGHGNRANMCRKSWSLGWQVDTRSYSWRKWQFVVIMLIMMRLYKTWLLECIQVIRLLWMNLQNIKIHQNTQSIGATQQKHVEACQYTIV